MEPRLPGIRGFEEGIETAEWFSSHNLKFYRPEITEYKMEQYQFGAEATLAIQKVAGYGTTEKQFSARPDFQGTNAAEYVKNCLSWLGQYGG